MSARADIAATNARVYESVVRARWYGGLVGLTPAEEAAFALTEAWWRDGAVLDIGIGGGRTCEALAGQARRYVGVDYSTAMVEVARARHPSLDLRPGDARDLSQFADGTFDFAFFADNGLDAVDDADRMRILGEVRRVLRPGGVFLFNSHNLDCVEIARHWRVMLTVRLSRSPVATLRAFGRIPVRMRNYLRSRAFRRRTDRYAIMPDPGNDFSSPHYYAGVGETCRQVAEAGFEVAEVLDAKGAPTSQAPERVSATLYYVARKPAV